jgi:hypothetical protein
MNTKMTGAELLDSGKRFSVAMWEYSWLVQRSGRQREYEDWDKVLDELAERGYDCVRIDAFPHCIANGPDGKRTDEFTFLPIDKSFMWGNHDTATANPRKGLVDFMKKAKQRGLYIGLSSWFNDDTTHRKLMIQSPADYARIWIETLDVLAQEDLLDSVVWVDLCNEFPLDMWSPAPCRDIVSPMTPEEAMQPGREWPQESLRRLEEYLTQSIEPVRKRYPMLRYTFSFQNNLLPVIQKADVHAFDLAEMHIWANDDEKWAEKTDFAHVCEDYPYKLFEYEKKCMQLYPDCKDELYRALDEKTDLWSAWAKKNNLPMITTEAWTSVFYEDMTHNGFCGEWAWFQEVAEMGVRLAIQKGWRGICTSNFAEPHFEGMWYDKAWHQKMNELIKRNGN